MVNFLKFLTPFSYHDWKFYKMLLRITNMEDPDQNMEDPDQTASSDLGLPNLPWPFLKGTSFRNFRMSTVTDVC